MILSNPFNQEQFYEFIKDFLPDFNKNEQAIDVVKLGFDKIVKLGESNLLDTSVLVIRGTKNIDSRVTLTNNSFKILKKYSIYRALVVYLNQDDSIWRLSLLTAVPSFDASGKVVVKYSNPRRHSYILGTDVGIATAKKYLYTRGKVQDFDDLENRFSVEAVNKDFYAEIAEHFYGLVGKYGPNKEVLQKPLLKFPNKISKIDDLQNYSVRLLGRVIFLWFLRQKSSHQGKPLLPKALLTLEGNSGVNFLQSSLEPLFFEVLNKPQTRRKEPFKSDLYNEVPYLNGGLFHPSEGPAGDFYNFNSKDSKVDIPNKWFEALFETLETYNFTIDENLESDVDLSIDPEMLGRVFENLLAEINPETGQIARKTTGSYYTPRAIVNFMVDESIRDYLIVKTGVDENKLKALLSINKHDDVDYPLSKEESEKVIEAISELKVLDPACGSGAFPMGVLQKILWVISQVDPEGTEYLESSDFEGTSHWLTSSRIDYLRKRKIIRDVIFGADIQTVAVEIAKLRCFLTLIVDQEIDDDSPNRGVIPLPNLEFKFICADSLVPLDNTGQMHLGDDPELENKLLKIREKYFVTFNEDKKDKLRKEYEGIVSQEAFDFGESNRVKQFKSFKPLTSNNQASFLDLQTMFGVNGFPIIIGNPPYKVLAGKESKDTLEKLKKIRMYKFALGGRLNLYRHFIERSQSFLSQDGILSFIVPSTLISDLNSSGIRRMFREKGSLKFIVEFPEKERVFESVTQATTIFLFKNGLLGETFKLSVGLNKATLPPESSALLSWDRVEALFGKNLTLPLVKSTIEVELMEKIKQNSTPLELIAKIYQGDINLTFESERLSNVETANLLIRGDHISSYLVDLSAKNADRRWFKAKKDTLISEEYRIVCQQVANMGLKKRLNVGIVPPKVIVANSANCIEIEDSDYTNAELTGLLNSTLMNWYFKKTSTNNHVNVYELNTLPIKKFGGKRINEFSDLVLKRIQITERNIGRNGISIDCLQVEEAIDNMIYELYGLTTEEILVVKQS